MIWLFHIGNAALLLALLTCLYINIRQGKHVEDIFFCSLKNKWTTCLSMLTCYAASRLLMETDGDSVETYGTLQLCLLYIAFVFLTGFSILFTNKKESIGITGYGLLIQYAVFLVLTNIIMRQTGTYKVFFTANGLIDFFQSGQQPMLAVGRIILTFILLSYFVIIIVLNVDSIVKSNRKPKSPASDMEANLHSHFLNTRQTIAISATVLLATASHISPLPIVSLATCATIGWLAIDTTNRLGKLSSLLIQEQTRNQSSELIRQKLSGSIDNQESIDHIFGNNATLESIASKLGTSKDELSDYIYNVLNTSFPAWNNQVKMSFSAKLLTNTSRSVTDIAISSGYADAAAFCKAFKKEYGTTPTDYRKQIKNVQIITHLLEK